MQRKDTIRGHARRQHRPTYYLLPVIILLYLLVYLSAAQKCECMEPPESQTNLQIMNLFIFIYLILIKDWSNLPTNKNFT